MSAKKARTHMSSCMKIASTLPLTLLIARMKSFFGVKLIFQFTRCVSEKLQFCYITTEVSCEEYQPFLNADSSCRKLSLHEENHDSM